MVPCKNCPCIAICRLKQFLKLFQDCSLLREYENCWNYPMTRSKDRMTSIVNMLQPIEWTLNLSCGGILLVAPNHPLIRP
jgi:hypothetical protein